MEPLVSIVINNYNYGCFLRQAIDSALAQTYSRAEVIVVDDGSTDNSLNIAAEYSDRIKIIRKENGGQASAFNRGFAESSGEWILFLDADDYLEPEALREVAIRMGPGVAKIHYPLRIISAKAGSETHGDIIPVAPVSDGNVGPLVKQTGNYVWPPTSGNVFSKAALGKILPMDEASYRICADLYLCLKITQHGEIRAVPQSLGYYRLHGMNNYSKMSMDGRHLKTQVVSWVRHHDLLNEIGATEAAARLWNNRLFIETVALGTRFADLRELANRLPKMEEVEALYWRAREAGWNEEQRVFRRLYQRIVARANWLVIRYGFKRAIIVWLRWRIAKQKKYAIKHEGIGIVSAARQ